LGVGVDFDGIGLKLDDACRLGKCCGGGGIVCLPVGDAACFFVARLTQTFVADVPAAQVGEQILRLGKRMAGAGATSQSRGLSGEEAVDAEALIQRIAAESASVAGEVGALNGQQPEGGYEGAFRATFVASGLAAGAGACRAAFFSRSSACC
jgi:hypothetical protein